MVISLVCAGLSTLSVNAVIVEKVIVKQSESEEFQQSLRKNVSAKKGYDTIHRHNPGLALRRTEF